jgi:hypothetical protein
LRRVGVDTATTTEQQRQHSKGHIFTLHNTFTAENRVDNGRQYRQPSTQGQAWCFAADFNLGGKTYADTTNRLMIKPMLTNHTSERTGAQSAR